MHELYIAESILNTVSEALPAGVHPESVLEVHVQVGQLDAVVPETLLFLFDAIKASKGMPRARLDIERIDILCRCEDCAREFGLDLPVFLCPSCGSGNLDVLQGRGISIQRINAEDT